MAVYRQDRLQKAYTSNPSQDLNEGIKISITYNHILCLHVLILYRKNQGQNSSRHWPAIYRISSNRRPGVYFLRDSADPAFKRGRRLNGAGVYLLHVFLAHAHPRYVAHAGVEIHFSSCDRMASQGSNRHTQ